MSSSGGPVRTRVDAWKSCRFISLAGLSFLTPAPVTGETFHVDFGLTDGSTVRLVQAVLGIGCSSYTCKIDLTVCVPFPRVSVIPGVHAFYFSKSLMSLESPGGADTSNFRIFHLCLGVCPRRRPGHSLRHLTVNALSERALNSHPFLIPVSLPAL